MRFPKVTVATERRGPGVTAWAVVVDGEVWASGLTERQAGVVQRHFQFHSLPAARAVARERLTGGLARSDQTPD